MEKVLTMLLKRKKKKMAMQELKTLGRKRTFKCT